MKYTLMSRRRLLRTVAGSFGALPFLSRVPFSFAAGEIPRRLLVWFTPNEPIEKKYWLPPGASGLESKLTGLTPIMEPLRPFMNKLLLVGDMTMNRIAKLDKGSGGHRGIGWTLTGMPNIPNGPQEYQFWAGGPSIDQFIAKRLGVEALTLAALSEGNNGNGRISYTGANQPVAPIEDPARAYERTFSGFRPAPGSTDTSLEAWVQQKKTVLGVVNEDLKTLKNQLPAEDVNKLDQHLEGLSALEKKLHVVPTGEHCRPAAPGALPAASQNDNYPVVSRLQADVIVQALACNITRVASLQLGSSGGGKITPIWSNEGIRISRDVHNIAHDYSTKGGAGEIKAREDLESFYYKQFAYLLKKLDEVPEGTGTLLDNTIVFWVKNISHDHKWGPMFYMIAGGGGGGLKTGRYLSYQDRSHNDLLSAVCQLMGQTDVKKFGHETVAVQPLPL